MLKYVDSCNTSGGIIVAIIVEGVAMIGDCVTIIGDCGHSMKFHGQ